MIQNNTTPSCCHDSPANHHPLVLLLSLPNHVILRHISRRHLSLSEFLVLHGRVCKRLRESPLEWINKGEEEESAASTSRRVSQLHLLLSRSSRANRPDIFKQILSKYSSGGGVLVVPISPDWMRWACSYGYEEIAKKLIQLSQSSLDNLLNSTGICSITIPTANNINGTLPGDLVFIHPTNTLLTASALGCAALNGHVSLVHFLLNLVNVNVNVRVHIVSPQSDANLRRVHVPVLSLAAFYGHFDVIQTVIDYAQLSPLPPTQSPPHRTLTLAPTLSHAISMAAINKHTRIVKYLLLSPAFDRTSYNPDLNLGLMLCARNGNLEMVELFLSTCPLVDPCDRDGEALMSAARNGHAKVVSRLLQDHRVITDHHQQQLLIYKSLLFSTRGGHIETVREILSRKLMNTTTTTTTTTTSFNLMMIKDDGLLLRLACRYGYKEIVEMILFPGKMMIGEGMTTTTTIPPPPPPLISPACHSNSPLRLASLFGYNEIAEMLLSTGVRLVDPTDDCKVDLMKGYGDVFEESGVRGGGGGGGASTVTVTINNNTTTTTTNNLQQQQRIQQCDETFPNLLLFSSAFDVAVEKENLELVKLFLAKDDRVQPTLTKESPLFRLLLKKSRN